MTRKLLQYPKITKIITFTYHTRIETNEDDVYTYTLY